MLFLPHEVGNTTAARKSQTDFVHKGLILISMADNMRSIPSIADVLKPGQRKAIDGGFKQNLVND